VTKLNLNLQTTTGIYVGAKNVYVAQVKGVLFGAQLLKFARVEIQAASHSDDASRRQATVQAITRALQENRISAKEVVAAIAGKDVLVRYFQMPLIPKSEWETAIKFEAKKYIPFKIEELVWGFHVVLPKSKDTNKMDVTFVAVKRGIAQRYLSLFEQAQLTVSALEPASFSLVRLLALSNQLEKEKHTAIVDVDYGMADINIVKDKICYLTRDVSLPLEEELLFDSLLNEIRMSLDYYEKLFPSETIDKILLCGEVELKDWDKKLAQELKLSVEKADPAKAVKPQKALPSLDMAIAIGLALRQRILAGTEVNLCQVREVQPKAVATKEPLQFTPRVKLALFRALTFAGMGLLILHLAMGFPVRREKKELEKVLSVRPQISLSIASFSYEELEKTKKGLEAKLSVLDQMINKKVFLTDEFNELPKLIPPGVWLTNLNFNDKLSKGNKVNRSLVLKGTAYHESAVREIGIVSKFVSNLKESKAFSQGFKEIKLDSMSSGELKGMPVKDFTISCFTR